jgi:hypothetical protein
MILGSVILIFGFGLGHANAVSNATSAFLPFAFIQSEPDVSTFLSLNTIQGLNETMKIYQSNILVNNVTESFPVLAGDKLTPSFESYFRWNGLKEPIKPEISNISVTLSRLLNPDTFTYLTQAELSSPISLQQTAGGMTNTPKSFEIPSDIMEGPYLVSANVSFPEYNLGAVYSNIIFILSNETMERCLELIPNVSSSPTILYKRDCMTALPFLVSESGEVELPSPESDSIGGGESGFPSESDGTGGGEFGFPSESDSIGGGESGFP